MKLLAQEFYEIVCPEGGRVKVSAAARVFL
jgi:hypothetical protein